MQITRISYPYQNKIYKPQFQGKFYPSGYYRDAEIRIAKAAKEIEGDEWIPHVKAHLIMDVIDEIGLFKFMYSKKGLTRMNEKLLRIARLRSDMLMEDIEKNSNLQKQMHQESVEKLIQIKAKKKITSKFLQKLSDKSSAPPTAIMIHEGNSETRKAVIDWTLEKAKNNCKTETYNCDNHENQVLYYLETQAEYAKERFEKRGLRTVIEMKNFDKFLAQNPSGMKDFMSEISNEHLPITIIFEAQDPKILPTPYTGNHVRIPLKIKADKSILEQKDFDDLKKFAVKLEPYLDGYKFTSGENKPFGLFLGDFGYSKHILWVDSDNPQDIENVVANIKEIKKLEKFKNVTLLQCPINDFSKIKGMCPTRLYTADFKQISQMPV